MFDVSPTELIFILLVALVVFGPKQLPDMARKLARWVREIQQTAGELQRSLSKEVSTLKEPLQELKQPLEDVQRSLDETRRDLEAGQSSDPGEASPPDATGEGDPDGSEGTA